MGFWSRLFGGDRSAAENAAVIAYLKSGGPMCVTCLADASKQEVVTRYYSEYARDPTAPRLTWYVLTARKPSTTRYPLLVVATGTLDEHHRRHDATAIRDRALPGKGWADLWGSDVEDRMNFAMRGCELTTMAPFTAVAADIALGRYQVFQSIRSA